MKISLISLMIAAMAGSIEAFTSLSPTFSRSLVSSYSYSRQSTEMRAAPKKAAKTPAKTPAKKPAKVEEVEDSVETMRKPEFIARIAEKTGMTKTDSEAALAAVLETITEGVASGKKISMLGFGTFKLTNRAARKGRNPKTGEEIDIPASKTPSFSAGKSFKDRCNSA